MTALALIRHGPTSWNEEHRLQGQADIPLSADGRAKVRALAPSAPLVDLFDGAQLGGAVGRDRLVHAVVERGKLAERIILECGRLAGLVEGDKAGPLAG